MSCDNCGTPLPADANFCFRCGKPIRPGTAENESATPPTPHCQWLHERLEELPLIAYPFALRELPTNGIYAFYERGETWARRGAATHRADRHAPRRQLPQPHQRPLPG